MDKGASQIMLTQIWQNLLALSFIWPWLLAALPLPFVVRALWRPAPKNQAALLAPQLMARFDTAKALESPSPKRSWGQSVPWLGGLIWLCLVLAAMRPVWYLTATPFNVSGKDLILAVDLSGSMEKNDMRVGAYAVDRLTAVKSVVHRFIAQREGDRMGLVVFGTQAFFHSPLTYDLNALQQMLDETQIGMAGNNTAIGDAIGISLKHLPPLGESNRHQPILILLTDGTNTAGAVEPLDAAQKAKQAGLKIYTIGIGKAEPKGLDAFFAFSSRDMDILTLKEIAKITSGEFYLASDTRQLDEIYQTINQLESNEHQVNQYRLRSELYVWPLGLAFILGCLLTLKRLTFPSSESL